jgi:hypothetical protein
MEGERPESAIQVCWEIHEKNSQRETEGLREALKDLELSEGLILSHEGDKEVDGIPQAPVWRWMLGID